MKKIVITVTICSVLAGAFIVSSPATYSNSSLVSTCAVFGDMVGGY